MGLDEIDAKLGRGERLGPEEGLFLYEKAPSDWLRARADAVRRERHGDEAYFNRNIHFEPTNKCVYACKFCAFYRPPKATEAEGAWDYSFEDLSKKLDAYPVGSLTEIHITGGVHPDRGVEYGEALCAFVKSVRPEVHVKAFTAVEITYFAKKSGVSLEAALERLKRAGLNSLPGGGAEIFDPEVRRKIAGGKAPAHTWLEVHEAAHRLGLLSNATMLYGHVEGHRHRIDHMLRLRDLQDRTGGFKAFIPLRYRNESNALSHLPEVPAEEDLRNYAVARLFLDNIPHLKAYWVMLGLDLAAEALDYGVDDLDGTVDDTTRIYSMAGGMKTPAVTSAELGRLIRSRGRVPVERDSTYAKLGVTSTGH
ncbi:MAG: CofH family radical SAM protein [Fibrobacteres bacterium]|jgi:aminodeoxyfutalosine synthase|nr:CofH family radical SAM protein [Fibrobacterota bacterium]